MQPRKSTRTIEVMDEVEIIIRLQFSSIDAEQLQRLADKIYEMVERESDHGHLNLWDADLVDYEVDVNRTSLD